MKQQSQKRIFFSYNGKDELAAKNGQKYSNSFKDKKEVIPLPDLIEVQKESYDWFLREGIKEIFNEISYFEFKSEYVSWI